MGTRNLTMVIDQSGKTKIAQYGQWDGYLDGQGLTVLRFLKAKGHLDILKKSLDKIRFFDREGRDKEFIEAYDNNAPEWSNDPDNRTKDQIEWCRTFQSRDIAAEILCNVSSSVASEILLRDASDFIKDSACEYSYIIDFMTNMLKVVDGYNSKNNKEYSLFNLPTEEEFLKTETE